VISPRLPSLDSASPLDLAARTYEKLRALIVAGRISPGSRFIETDLAARFGVSRTPVRVALDRLRQEGLAVSLGGGRNARLVVSPLTEPDSRELLLLIGVVEGLAARTAAALTRPERVRLAVEMHDLNRSMARTLEREAPELEEVFLLHSSFHAAAIELAGTPRIRALHATILPQAERYRRVYMAASPRELREEVAEHAPIIAAIEGGDTDAAQIAVQQNWSAAAERLGRMVDRSGERGC
jgi:DNA-binding GntR family transcriptional regulator